MFQVLLKISAVRRWRPQGRRKSPLWRMLLDNQLRLQKQMADWTEDTKPSTKWTRSAFANLRKTNPISVQPFQNVISISDFFSKTNLIKNIAPLARVYWTSRTAISIENSLGCFLFLTPQFALPHFHNSALETRFRVIFVKTQAQALSIFSKLRVFGGGVRSTDLAGSGGAREWQKYLAVSPPQ